MWFGSLYCRQNPGFFTPRMSRCNSRSSRSYNDGAVPESLGSVGVGVGGGWQLAWQKDGEEGALKRVYMKSDTGDLSNATHAFGDSHESFPVLIFHFLCYPGLFFFYEPPSKYRDFAVLK